MASSISIIRNMKLRVENDVILSGSDNNRLAKLSFISSNKVIGLATFLPFVAIWIMLVHIVINLNYAKMIGARLQDNCKSEYMENETVRYQLAQTYKKYNYFLFKVAPMLFLIPVGIMYIAFTEELYKLTTLPTILANDILYKVVFVTLVIFIGLPYAAIFLNIFGINHLLVKYNVEMKYKRTRLINNLMYTSIMFAYVIVFLLFSYLHVSSRVLYFMLGIAIIWIVSSIYLSRLHAFYNTGVLPYEKKVNEVNALIKDRKDAMLERYFLTNIRRAHPNETIDNLNSNSKYNEKLYAYLMHRNGNETFSLAGTSHVVSLRTLKNAIRYYYLMPIRSSDPDFTTDMNAIEVSIQSKSGISSYSFASLSFQLRYHMFNLLYQNAGLKLPNIDAIPSSLPSSVRNWSIDGKFLRNVLEKYQPYPDAVSGKFGANAPVRSWNAADILSELIRGNGYDKQDTTIDVFLCVLLQDEKYDDSIMIDLKMFKTKINKVQDTLSNFEKASVYSVLTRVSSKIDELIEYQPLRTLQRNMAELRNMNAPMIRGANGLINAVFWASVAIILAVSFTVFHFMYKHAKDLTGILFAGIVLILFVICALYSWIMGNVK